MSKFFKIDDQVVQYPNDFEVIASGQGGDVKTITAAFGTISEGGTALDKTLLEGMQKNSVYSVDGTRVIETVNEIYDITVTDMTDALLFDELKINLAIDADNTQSSNVYIRLDAVLYPIYLNNAVIPAGSLKANGRYLLEYDGTRFNLDSNVKASEAQPGVAELATQTETDAGIDDEKIVTPKKLRFGFNVSLGEEGYIDFPTWMGGLQLRWGKKYIGDIGTPGIKRTTSSFPSAFSTALLLAIPSTKTIANDSGAVDTIVHWDQYNSTTSVMGYQYSEISGVVQNVTLTYFAIGY